MPFHLPAPPIRLLQVGFGTTGRRRVAALAGDVRVRIVGVADPDASARAAVHDALDASTIVDASAERLLVRLRPDAVVVSTPPHTQRALVSCALRFGAGVLCEKPLGRDRTEAAACAEEARAVERILRMGTNHLAFPSVRMARRLVDRGLLGSAHTIRLAVGHGRLADLPPWMLDHGCSGGGTLRDNGTHAFLALDALLACDGDAVESMRCVVTSAPGIPDDVESFARCTMRTRLGKAVVSTASWTDTVPYRFDLVVQGERGTLVIRGPDRLQLRRPEGLRRMRWFTSPARSWQRDTRMFVDALTGTSHTNGSVAAAVRSATLVDAAYESAATRRTIRLTSPRVPSPGRDALHATGGLPPEPA